MAVSIPPRWTLRTAIYTTKQICRDIPRAFWLRVDEFVGIYVLAQE